MNEDGLKEVYFYKYCKRCKYRHKPDGDMPCNECLDEPMNLYSHKPVNFEEAERRKK